jgi:hypothetical protein
MLPFQRRVMHFQYPIPSQFPQRHLESFSSSRLHPLSFVPCPYPLQSSLTPSPPPPPSSVPESNSSPPNPHAQPAPAPARRETAAPKSQPCSAAATPYRSAAHLRPPSTVRAKCRAVCLSTGARVCRRAVALGASGRTCRGLRGGGSCGRFW